MVREVAGARRAGLGVAAGMTAIDVGHNDASASPVVSGTTETPEGIAK